MTAGSFSFDHYTFDHDSHYALLIPGVTFYNHFTKQQEQSRPTVMGQFADRDAALRSAALMVAAGTDCMLLDLTTDPYEISAQFKGIDLDKRDRYLDLTNSNIVTLDGLPVQVLVSGQNWAMVATVDVADYAQQRQQHEREAVNR